MIDVALFGAGRIGTIHAGNVARQPGVRLKYVVDVDAAAAGEARAAARREDRGRRDASSTMQRSPPSSSARPPTRTRT